jgi:hypothetical protein
MTTLHFKVYYRMPDGGEIPNPGISTFDCSATAEEIMHDMQSGLFDEGTTRFEFDRIVYELEEEA